MDPLIVVPVISAVVSMVTAAVHLLRVGRERQVLPSITIRRPDGEEVVISSFEDSAEQRRDLEEALHGRPKATTAS